MSFVLQVETPTRGYYYYLCTFLVENIIADSRQTLISVAAEIVYGNVSLFLLLSSILYIAVL